MRRLLAIVGIVLLGLVVLVFLFISPIAKYAIEKNSEALTGRKIKIESLWINIFGGSIHMEGFRMLERNSDSSFIRIADFYGNIALNQLLAGRYYVETLRLTRPEITIRQKGDHFNFDDLLKRFSDTSSTAAPGDTTPAEYRIENLSIRSAVLNYNNFRPLTSVSLVDIFVSSPPIASGDSVYRIRCDFGLQRGGRVNTVLNVRTQSMAYGLFLKTDKLNLDFLLPYLKDYMKVQSLDGRISSRLLLAGHLDKTT